MRRSSRPKVLVHRAELGEPPRVLGEIWAVVEQGSSALSLQAPRFPPDAVSVLAEYLDQRLLGPPAAPAWNLPALLAEAGRTHGHLCPGQVLGVRMAIAGCERLGIADPKSSKRLLVFVETDRCGTDAVQTVTGCTLGKRTLRFFNYGKLAATFFDLQTGRAVRISAKESARDAAQRLLPDEPDRHAAQLRAYKTLPDAELLTVEDVTVTVDAGDLPGSPHTRVTCARCGEGVNDGRHEVIGDEALCSYCARGGYYQVAEPVPSRTVNAAGREEEVGHGS
jgi:formylmethanofuran dehydrogenase subunit E